MADSPNFASLWLADMRELARHAALGAGTGLCAAVALCLIAGLYPWFENDAQALGLIGLMFALPLGAALGVPGKARLSASRATGAGIALALVLGSGSGFSTASVSWYCAAGLLGACAGALGRWGALFSTALWLMLGALPFFYHRLADTLLGSGLEIWASQGCPWLGFAQAALVTDPLRKTLLYFGHWTPLSGAPAQGFLSAQELWLLALMALGAALARPGFRNRQ